MYKVFCYLIFIVTSNNINFKKNYFKRTERWFPYTIIYYYVIYYFINIEKFLLFTLQIDFLIYKLSQLCNIGLAKLQIVHWTICPYETPVVWARKVRPYKITEFAKICLYEEVGSQSFAPTRKWAREGSPLLSRI